MTALRQPKAPLSTETPSPAIVSPANQFRALTSYEHDAGYAPLYAAWIPELTRLSSGESFWAFVLTVAVLSLGREPKKIGGSWKRHESTLPLSLDYLAQVTGCSERSIQRLLSELSERGVIASKLVKNPACGYVITLRYREWPTLEDYAIWNDRRRQASVVEIDSDAEDEAAPQVGEDAVRLTRRPRLVRAGRSSKAAKLNAEVREVSFVPHGACMAFDGVIESGRLTVFATVSHEGESEAKGEAKANGGTPPVAVEYPQTGVSVEKSDKRSKNENALRSDELKEIFDPVLEKSGARLLRGDSLALHQAGEAYGAEMPREYLERFLFGGPDPRGRRPISSPRAVVSIVREARTNWEALREEVVRPCAPDRPLEPEDMTEPWGSIKREVAAKVSSIGYENWLRDTRLIECVGDRLVVCVADEATKSWLLCEYGVQIQAAVKAHGLSLEYVVAK